MQGNAVPAGEKKQSKENGRWKKQIHRYLHERSS
jgi:hypothetical protein